MNEIKKILVQNGYDESEIDEILYGIKKLQLFGINLIVSLGIGFLFKCGKEMSVFLLLYIPLRLYSGGLHMDKLWKCELFSTMIIVFVAILFRFGICHTIDIYMSTLVLVVFSVSHILLAPQDNEKKRLYGCEIKRFKRIVRILISIYIVLYFGCELNESFMSFRESLLISITISGMSLVENYIYEMVKSRK